MQNTKKKNPYPIKFLSVIFLLFLCCNMPNLFFWSLCLKQDLIRPPHTEVIVSSCKRPVATGVPGGEVIFLYEGRTNRMYLMDLQTGEKRDVPNDPLLLDRGIFLSEELVWLEGSYTQPETSGYRPHYILDLTDGKRYPLLDLGWLPRLDNYEFDTKYYSIFPLADQVFLHHSKNVLIALSPDFRDKSEGRVILYQYYLESGTTAEDGAVLEQLMKNMGVDYEIIDLSTRYEGIPSPTRRYVARNDGIYLSGTNSPIMTREYAGGNYLGGYFRGWYYDESAVVSQEIGYFLFSNPILGSYYIIPRPVLKLQLPMP